MLLSGVAGLPARGGGHEVQQAAARRHRDDGGPGGAGLQWVVTALSHATPVHAAGYQNVGMTGLEVAMCAAWSASTPQPQMLEHRGAMAC